MYLDTDFVLMRDIRLQYYSADFILYQRKSYSEQSYTLGRHWRRHFMHAKLKQQFLEHENEPPLLCFIGIHFLAERRKKNLLGNTGKRQLQNCSMPRYYFSHIKHKYSKPQKTAMANSLLKNFLIFP